MNITFNEKISYNFNEIIDDNNDGFIDDLESNYYNDIIEYNLNSINTKWDKTEWKNNICSYIIYLMFNAVIYKLIVGEKKMYELYGNKENNLNNQEIIVCDDINGID